MATRTWRACCAGLAILALVPGAALAAGTEEPAKAQAGKADPDLEQAKRAIEAEDWAEAVSRLKKAEARQATADTANWLGYAERKRGNLDAAFEHYARALRLDPKHRGAHEYVGEAYLMVGNVSKAEEHLAALADICGRSCEEYEDLAEEIAEFKKRGG